MGGAPISQALFTSHGLRRLLAACLGAALVFTLSACGQKGPLYLPESKPAPEERDEA